MTTRSPQVSVVMATFNGARFITEQLESLTRQTLLPYELVVGDDISTDDTVSIVRSFAERSPFPVTWRVNPGRLHFGENFLRNAMLSRGKYVAFCDQDDIWLPNKLATCVAALEQTNALMCSHNANLIDCNGQLIGGFKQFERGTYPPLSLPPWSVMAGFTTVFRRTLLDIFPYTKRGTDNITFERLLAHDRWTYFLSQTFGTIQHLDIPLVNYRQHATNVFGAGRRLTLPQLRKLLTTDTGYLSRHVSICLHRAAMLGSLSQTAGNELSGLAKRGQAYWSRMAGIYEKRLAIITSRKFLTGAFTLRELVSLSAYARFERGGLSGRAFIKDLATLLTSRRKDTEQASGKAAKPEEITSPHP